MSDEAQMDSTLPADAQVADTGTIQEGQPSDSDVASASQPNDPNAFQADYTRKYQELAEQRRQVELEKQALEVQRAQIIGQGNGYTQQQYQPQPFIQQPQQPHVSDQQLIDQFGYEGAQLIRQREQAISQQLIQTQIDIRLAQEEMLAKQKFGEVEYLKHNYVDQRTGQVRNRMMDYRLSINPVTQQHLTWEQAHMLANPVSEQSVRDKVYGEIQNKSRATPAPAAKSAPRATGTGHAKSISEAFAQAAADVGWEE